MSEINVGPIQISQILTTSVAKAKALEDPIRVMMLQMLSQKPCSIEELVKGLKKKGVKKAPTSVRHHLEILKEANLVALSKIQEMKGGFIKYYASNVRIIGHDVTKEFEANLGEGVSEASREILKIVSHMTRKFGSELRAAAKSLKPCPYCSSEHFIEYAIVESLHRAIALASRTREFKNQVRLLVRSDTQLKTALSQT